MIIILNEDSHIGISKSTGEDSLNIEIGEHRGSVEQVFVSLEKTIVITFAPDGFRISI